MNRFERAKEKRAELQVQQDRLSELYGELDRAIEIGLLWPEAFDLGAIKCHIEGNPYNSLRFVIERSDGEVRKINLHDVPFILWSEPVKEQIRLSRGAGNVYRATLLRHERAS